jgi:hypothetical protein
MIAMLLLIPSAEYASGQTPDLEPGVQTSSPPPAAAPPEAAPPQAQPARPQPAHPQPAHPQPVGAPGTTAAAKDRIELDTTQISGNRELPKVMYVVPWRRADPGEFAGRPPNSLLDEALTPVDRDVFRRQNRYYAALEAGSGTPGAPASKDEK